MRDSQRTAVYRWESAIKKRWPELDTRLPLDECRNLIKKVWADYRPGENPPELADGRGTRTAYGSRWRINLPVWARTKLVVLHEIAHSLLSPQLPFHGREFARLVLELWRHYAGLPIREAKGMAVRQKPRRVHFARAADVPKQPRSVWIVWKKRLDELSATLRSHRENEPERY